jgi:hypothetical protein
MQARILHCGIVTLRTRVATVPVMASSRESQIILPRGLFTFQTVPFLGTRGSTVGLNGRHTYPCAVALSVNWINARSETRTNGENPPPSLIAFWG